MSYLLDTCVISELIKPGPDAKVLDWFSRCDEELLYISCLTVGELSYGLGILPEGKKKNDLMVWYNDFVETYKNATLPVTDSVCARWGTERARHRLKGIQLPAIDGLIACTALEHNYTLVTRNTADYAMITVPVFNPWL